MATFHSLFVDVNPIYPFLIIHFRVNEVFPPHLRVDSAEISRTPHLIGVELIRAAELISISSAFIIYTVVKGVTCLEANLSVEIIPVEITDEGKFVVRQCSHL